MKRLFVLACALALALCAHNAGSSPAVYPYGEGDQKVIYSDTLGMLASDSVAVTDSINVDGARFVVLYVWGDGADSIAVPVMQTKARAVGQWVGTGGTVNLGAAVGTTGMFKNITTTTLVNGQPLVAVEIHTEIDGSGTPRPWPVAKIRFRLKSTDVRRITGTAQTSSGRITFSTIVYR